MPYGTGAPRGFNTIYRLLRRLSVSANPPERPELRGS